MNDNPTVSVVVPVYFNAGSLSELHRRLKGVSDTLRAEGAGLEIVFVDDGSGDQSFEVLRDLPRRDPRVRLIRHARNFGAFQAMKTGIAHARGNCVVTLSADLQDPPELILDMVRRWRDGELFVIAVRASRDDSVDRRLTANLYYRILRWMILPDYPVGGFDFMLIDRRGVPYLLEGPKNVNINLYAYWLGFTPSVIEYHRDARNHGKSRWTLRKRINLFLDTVTSFSVRPVRLMSLFGLTVALASFSYALYVGIVALTMGSPAPGFPTLAILISFFSGLIMFMLGLIGEYLWRIFDAVNRRPEAVVAEVVE